MGVLQNSPNTLINTGTIKAYSTGTGSAYAVSVGVSAPDIPPPALDGNIVINKGELLAFAESMDKSYAVAFGPDTLNNTFNYYTSGKLIGQILFSDNNDNVFLLDAKTDFDHIIACQKEMTLHNLDNLLMHHDSARKVITIISKTPYAQSDYYIRNTQKNIYNALENKLFTQRITPKGKNESEKPPGQQGFWGSLMYGSEKLPKYKDMSSSKLDFSGLLLGYHRTKANIDYGVLLTLLDAKDHFNENQTVTDKHRGLSIGGYLNNNFGVFFIDARLFAGYYKSKRSRLAYYNLSPTGETLSHGKSNDYMISPSAQIGKLFLFKESYLFSPMLSLACTHSIIGKQKESGVITTELNRHSITSLSGRLKFALSKLKLISKKTSAHISTSLGYTKYIAKKTLKNQLNGFTPVSFKIPSPIPFDLQVGAYLQHTLKEKFALFIDGNLTRSVGGANKNNLGASAKVGLTYNN